MPLAIGVAQLGQSTQEVAAHDLERQVGSVRKQLPEGVQDLLQPEAIGHGEQGRRLLSEADQALVIDLVTVRVQLPVELAETESARIAGSTPEDARRPETGARKTETRKPRSRRVRKRRGNEETARSAPPSGQLELR